MTDVDLAKLLWDLSNVIVGFAVAQTLAFAYKMSDEKFSDLIDNQLAKIIVAISIVLSIFIYIFVFYRITKHLKALDSEALHPIIYGEVMWWRVALVMSLLAVNLAALFARQILLGRWVFGCPRPTLIASVKPGTVTIVGTVKSVSDDGARKVEDRSGSIDVHAGGRTAELLAQSSALGRRVLVIGRIDEQGRLTADAVR